MTEDGATISLDELVELREKTDRVSRFLEERVGRHIKCLQQLFGPARIFGRFASRGAPEIRGAERAVSELREKYREACREPFKISEDLGDDPLRNTGSGISVFNWEYAHAVPSEAGSRTLAVISPFRWLIAHDANVSLAEVRRSLPLSRGDAGNYSSFLVGAITLGQVVDRHAELATLLLDLGYKVDRVKHPDLGAAVFTTLEAPVRSFRPADEVILKAVKMTGGDEFTELLDLESLSSAEDALLAGLRKALA